MHISEGILPVSLCIAGYGGTAVLTAFGLKKTEQDHIPAIAVMGAAFFTASLIHFKIGVSSVHLTLIGLTAIILGYRAIPAILAGLFFQAVLFQHGGISTLGVNALIMMTSALFCHLLFTGLTKGKRNNPLYISTVAGGATLLAVLLATMLTSSVLIISGDEFAGLAALFTVSNAALALVEGVLTGIIVARLLKIKPEMILTWKTP